MEAAAAEGLCHLARPVGREEDQRRLLRVGLDRPELGDRHLELGEHLEQEGLELGVGAVDLVDQEHHRLRALEREEERARDQEVLAEERGLAPGHDGGGLSQARRARDLPRDRFAQELRVEHLLGVVPLVEGLGLVEAPRSIAAAPAADRAPPPRRGRDRSCPRRRGPRGGPGASCAARARPSAPWPDPRGSELDRGAPRAPSRRRWGLNGRAPGSRSTRGDLTMARRFQRESSRDRGARGPWRAPSRSVKSTTRGAYSAGLFRFARARL